MNTKHYLVTYPCRNGHIAPRLISTGGCTQCQSDAAKRWKLRNPEAHEYQKRKWAAKRPYSYTEADRIRMTAYYRKRAGIPPATRPVPEICECCGEKLLGGKLTHLDHCHKTGKFRGWLCNRCNRGLGYFDDCIEGLERAIAYLRRVEG